MQSLSLAILKNLGLAYWLTVTDANQKSYTFGPFISASQAVSLQERCFQQLREGASGVGTLANARISMEP